MDFANATSSTRGSVPTPGVPGEVDDLRIDPETVAQALGAKVGHLTVENEQLRAALSAVSDALHDANRRLAASDSEREQLRERLRSATAEHATPLAVETTAAETYPKSTESKG